MKFKRFKAVQQRQFVAKVEFARYEIGKFQMVKVITLKLNVKFILAVERNQIHFNSLQ